MHTASRFLIAVILSSVAFAAYGAAFAPGQPQLTTVILVRHAEKVDDSKDPLLSPAGIARAKELARVLGGTKIDAIYVTQYHRAADTAAPIAAAAGLTPIVAGTGKTYAADLTARIARENYGKTVLVVGHSNSTVDVLRVLGFAEPPPIADSQYDDLFIVTLGVGALPRLVALRYGAPAR